MPSLEFPKFGDASFLETYGEFWSSCSDEKISEAFSDNGEYVEMAYGNTYKGQAEVARFARFMLRFSSDAKIKYPKGVGRSEEFALEWCWSGTFDGVILIDGEKKQATGRKYNVPGVAWCRANEHGRITYHCDYYDLRDLMRQIGVAS